MGERAAAAAILAAKKEQRRFVVRAKSLHLANNDVVVATLVDGVGPALEAGDRAGQDRHVIGGAVVIDAFKDRVVRLREVVGEVALMLAKHVDREIFRGEICLQQPRGREEYEEVIGGILEVAGIPGFLAWLEARAGISSALRSDLMSG